MTSTAALAHRPDDVGPSKPRLLAFNRKLRHLHGISLRNLAISTSPPQSRARSTDDEAVPHTLKSAAKLLSISESKPSHSRSYSDLSSTARHEAFPHPAPHPRLGTLATPTVPITRPEIPTLQRMNTSPKQRQESLNHAVARRTGDVFFSLHCAGLEVPIYISEVMKNSMNPDFRFFDLGRSAATITRQENLSIRFWVRPRSSTDWLFLVDVSLSLRYLQYAGKSLDAFHYALPENCVLFHLSDGIYTSFTDMPVEENGSSLFRPDQDKTTITLELSSSYDALKRLSTLEECIQDGISTRQRLADEINVLIRGNKARSATRDLLAEAEDSLAAVKRAVTSIRKQVRSSTTKLNDLRKNLQSRKDAMQNGRSNQANANEALRVAAESLTIYQIKHKQTVEEITRQRRRICEDLLDIFPIDPIPKRSLAFTIRNLPLPNSNFEDAREDVVSAALGHVAHLSYLLSLYLSAPLPYPISPSSSTSLISDPVSLLAGSRFFPLYIRGSVFFRFEYGVFLLNKDIELLASSLGLHILDIRQTGPNLKYVLYVATAGQGDLPSRKAGGVRGLIKDKEKGAPGSSRRGSFDSSNGKPGLRASGNRKKANV